MTLDFQKRIAYQGDLAEVARLVCDDYLLGDYQEHHIIPVGYEDLNLKLISSRGTFFMKIFASFRSGEDCDNYIQVITKVLAIGVAHPNLMTFAGEVFWERKLQGSTVRLCVMDWVEGSSFYDLKTYPTPGEICLIAQEAAKINTVQFKPEFVYDQWAVVNFPQELEKVLPHLTKDEQNVMQQLLKDWREVDIDALPHVLVHGDLTTTNVLRLQSGGIAIIDFAVANYYPRIIELAIIAVDLLFDPGNLDQFSQKWSLALNAYQETLELTPPELETLPLFIKVAHAMHVIGATRELTEGNTSEENEFWLNKGRVGLRYSLTNQ